MVWDAGNYQYNYIVVDRRNQLVDARRHDFTIDHQGATDNQSDCSDEHNARQGDVPRRILRDIRKWLELARHVEEARWLESDIPV